MPRGGAASLVPCTSTRVDFPYQNVIGGAPDERIFIETLDNLYRERETRVELAARCLARAREERFGWASIGAKYLEMLDEVLSNPAIAEPKVEALA